IFISPTLAGAEGRDGVREFYTCLMMQIPKDLTFTPVTRTISTNRIVTEYVVSFTHDVTIDWLLPRIPPTGKQVEIPVIVIYTFKGNKLDSEHLYWDQASVLMQIGVLSRIACRLPRRVPGGCGNCRQGRDAAGARGRRARPGCARRSSTGP